MAKSKGRLLSELAEAPKNEDYADVNALPNTGNKVGDQAFAKASNRLYIWNGTGWYNIALINTSPTWDSGGQPSGSYVLDADSPQDATTITLSASDPEGLPINYTYVTGGSMDSMATISQDSSVFTITPKTVTEVGEGVELTGSITFRASDGVNILPQVSSFTLSFITSIENSKYTTLLATATGTSDNNNITDSSTNNHTITVAGNAHAGTFSPYRHGGYSTYFDGSGDWLELTGTALGNGDFTVEAWVWLDSLKDYNLIYDDRATGSSATGLALGVTSTGAPYLYTNNGFQITSSQTCTAKTWHHISLVRSSGVITIYLDGTSGGTYSSSANFTDTNLGIGVARTYTVTSQFGGYIRDVRAVVGSAITPPSGGPTEPLTAITNTSLLTCHLPYIADGSSNGHSITTSGDPETKPFGPYDYKEYLAANHGGSIYFDGTGDWLTTPNVSDFDLSSSSTEFTIEGWVYRQGSNHLGIIGARQDGQAQGWCVYIRNDGTLYTGSVIVGNAYTDRQLNTTVIPLNTWAHIAVVKTATGYKGYVNGVGGSELTLTGGFDYQSSQPLIVGALGSQGELPFLGNLSDIRVTKGQAIYTTDFTPPTAPLSSTGSTLHIKGTEASIVDNSQTSNLQLVGNTTGSTTQVKFADTKSIYFASTSATDYASSKHGGLLSLSGPFTIEFWCNMNTGGSASYTYFFYWSGTNYTARLTDSGFGNRLQLCFDAQSSTGTYAVNATRPYLAGLGWFHFAWTRDNNNDNRVFINGSIVNVTGGSVGWSSYPAPSSFPASSFNDNRTLGSSADFVFAAGDGGYVQDFRVTNGLARYTANFTPPTEPLKG